MEKLLNAWQTTFKQIRRSGWLAWSSVSVMTLAFLVSTIFTFLAYASNLFLISLEQEPQIYVFFEIGTNESDAIELQNRWQQREDIVSIEYTSESDAKQEFYNFQKNVNELVAKAIEDTQLPSSLAIKLTSLDNFEQVSTMIETEEDQNPIIFDVLYSSEIIDSIREVLFYLRLGGGIIMSLLLIVIVLFTLLTVEFRTHSRSEEIEIMQLVGGSLGYIRLPFVIEGAFYGAVGAFISNVILGGLASYLYFQFNQGNLIYLTNLFGRLNWPELSPMLIIGIILTTVGIGIILGAVNSFIAIRRYIK